MLSKDKISTFVFVGYRLQLSVTESYDGIENHNNFKIGKEFKVK